MSGHRPITPNPGVVIKVAGFCHACNRKQQQIGLGPTHGPDRHFKLRALDRIPGLKSHNPAPSELIINISDLLGRHAKLFKVRMQRKT